MLFVVQKWIWTRAANHLPLVIRSSAPALTLCETILLPSIVAVDHVEMKILVHVVPSMPLAIHLLVQMDLRCWMVPRRFPVLAENVLVPTRIHAAANTVHAIPFLAPQAILYDTMPNRFIALRRYVAVATPIPVVWPLRHVRAFLVPVDLHNDPIPRAFIVELSNVDNPTLRNVVNLMPCVVGTWFVRVAISCDQVLVPFLVPHRRVVPKKI